MQERYAVSDRSRLRLGHSQSRSGGVVSKKRYRLEYFIKYLKGIDQAAILPDDIPFIEKRLVKVKQDSRMWKHIIEVVMRLLKARVSLEDIAHYLFGLKRTPEVKARERWTGTKIQPMGLWRKQAFVCALVKAYVKAEACATVSNAPVAEDVGRTPQASDLDAAQPAVVSPGTVNLVCRVSPTKGIQWTTAPNFKTTDTFLAPVDYAFVNPFLCDGASTHPAVDDSADNIIADAALQCLLEKTKHTELAPKQPMRTEYISPFTMEPNACSAEKRKDPIVVQNPALFLQVARKRFMQYCEIKHIYKVSWCLAAHDPTHLPKYDPAGPPRYQRPRIITRVPREA